MIILGKMEVKLTPFLDNEPLPGVIYTASKISIYKTYDNIYSQNNKILAKTPRTITITLFYGENDEEEYDDEG